MSSTTGDLFSFGKETNGVPTSVDSVRGTHMVSVAGSRSTSLSLHPTTATFHSCNPAHQIDPKDLPPGIVDVKFGETHAVVLTDKGQVFSYGKGKYGQLGLGGSASGMSTRVALPVLSALADKRVVSISAGSHHTVALTEGGDVFSWGRGFEGQTGHASQALTEEENNVLTAVQLLPKLISAFVRHTVVSVSCGPSFTLCCTGEGSVWSWGEGGCGQLGIGRKKVQPIPTLVLPSAPHDSSPFTSVSCGWSHSLALTKSGSLYSWGLNNYGQLGLGDQKTRYYPEVVCGSDAGAGGGEGDADGGVGGMKLEKVEAFGNYCMGLDGGGGVYSWGCNSSFQLGLGDSEHRSIPTPLTLLLPNRVTHLASTHQTTYAYTPSSIYSLSPPCGPISGGSKLFLKGGGFWSSDNITVRFIPPKEEKKAVNRATAGNFIAPEASAQDSASRDGASDTAGQMILCKTPRFGMVGKVTVEVSMNGKDFTRSGMEYQYYQDTHITAITPQFTSVYAPVTLAIDGTHLLPMDELKVRFKSKSGGSIGGSPSTVVVGGKFMKEVCGKEIDPETEEEVDVYRSFVTCRSPIVDMPRSQLPWETRVAVALNGVDFKTLEKKTFVFHDFRPERMVPNAAPVEGGTTIAIKGSSFFEPAGGGIVARFRFKVDEGISQDEIGEDESEEDESGEKIHTITVPCTCVDKNTLTLSVYSLLDQNPKSPNFCSLDLSHVGTTIRCRVDISIDGGETYLPSGDSGPDGFGSLEFTYYNPVSFSASSDTFTGPSTGGTLVSFLADSALFESSEVKVRFWNDEGTFDVEVGGRTRLVGEEPGKDYDVDSEEGQGEERKMFVDCETPKFLVVDVEQEGEGKDGEEKDGTEEEKEGVEKKKNEEESELEDNGDQPLDEEENFEGGEVDEDGNPIVGGGGEMSGSSSSASALLTRVNVAIAFNGIDYEPLERSDNSAMETSDKSFEYYDPPIFSLADPSSPPVVRGGEDFCIGCRGGFDSEGCTVKFVNSGGIEGVAQGRLVRKGVECKVPVLLKERSIPLDEEGGGEDGGGAQEEEEGKEGFGEEKKGGEEEEEEEETDNVFDIEVSMNGVDFGKTDLQVIYDDGRGVEGGEEREEEEEDEE